MLVKIVNKLCLLSLYTLLIVCMGLATIIEEVKGSGYAHEMIYGSWWFILLWVMLAFTAVAFMLMRQLHRKVAVFMLHVSFLVILMGALVTHLFSEKGEMHLRVGETVSYYHVTDNGGRTSVISDKLPFNMTLAEFDIQHYPGTDAVMDYRCSISVEGSGEVEHISVSMNNVGRVSGYRFYQSSYDSDGQGTTLLVSHDPYGIAITYTGYLMLLVSLLWTLFSRHTRLRKLYRIATKPLAVLALLCVTSVSARAADITPVSKDIAHEFGHVVVLYNGRLCPINTAANDFVTKLCGKSSWNGYSSDEIFMGWMIYYSEWEQQKIILVKSEEVQRMLGIEGKWASVRDFYTNDNIYKLSGKSNDITLPSATRKAVREVDEKIQVVTMFYNSEMLRMFPLPDARTKGGRWNGNWYTPGCTELPLGTPNAEFQFINHAMDHLVKYVLVNNVEGAREIIAKIKLYQKEKAGKVMPSDMEVSIEVFYNLLQSMRWVVFLCLTWSLLFCLLALSDYGGNVLRLMHTVLIVLQSLFLTLLFVLRWIVSGHVPMSNGYETMLFMAWITLVLTLLVMRKIPVMKAFGPVVSSLCMLVSMLAVGSPQITQLMPVLQSPLLSVHVAMVMVSYALLAIITLVAIQSLVLAHKGRNEELTRMTALSQLMLYPAVATLAVGIFVGAVWANVSWGTYWSWDPKETWALITLMIYAVPLHKSMMNLTPVKYHLYVLLSFLTVLMTYFGVNYFLGGMHSYA